MDASVALDDPGNTKTDRGTGQRHSLPSFGTMLPAHEFQHGVDGNQRLDRPTHVDGFNNNGVTGINPDDRLLLGRECTVEGPLVRCKPVDRHERLPSATGLAS
jgi:hypothetical protein